MIRNMWRKITAFVLVIMLVLPSETFANMQTASLRNVKTAALSEETDITESDDKSGGDAATGDSTSLSDDSEAGNLDLNAEDFSWKHIALTTIQSAAEIAIDIAEEEGILDKDITSEGYDNLRLLARGITDPKAREEAIPLIQDAAVSILMLAVINRLMPYIIEAMEFLDSIGIGSDEIVELAGLIPEEYQPIVKDILACTGIVGLTDPNDTIYPTINDRYSSTWAIYIYAAGNDLETRSWALTHDIEEIMQTRLPENVKVVIEGGGAIYMHNEYMDADYRNRCVYDSEGMHVISQTPRQNMGEQQTLEGFLDWCTSEYPADNTMLVFWGHGGATDGVCPDENYDDDSLTLTEIRGAVDNVFGEDRKEPVFDVVGFDACLMATMETVSVCGEFASYLAASEETEPGNGWAYHNILAQIAATPEMNMEQLGRLLCASYLFNNAIDETDAISTFSYVDLAKADSLIQAYEDLGSAILNRYREDPSIKDKIFHIAADAETYGSMFGLRASNQIDLGDFASFLESMFPEESVKVLDELAKCVLYMDNGTDKEHSRGLSCMFPFNLLGESCTFYREVAASPSFLTYFEEAGYFIDEFETESEAA